MAIEEKKYLDYAGLAYYDEKIKALIKASSSDVTDKLIALIGAAEKGEDEKTLLERIAEIEEEIGDISELGEEFENLVKAILGESARAQGVEKELSDAIGVPTIEPDEDGEGGQEGTGLTKRIEDLETFTGEHSLDYYYEKDGAGIINPGYENPLNTAAKLSVDSTGKISTYGDIEAKFGKGTKNSSLTMSDGKLNYSLTDPTNENPLKNRVDITSNYKGIFYISTYKDGAPVHSFKIQPSGVYVTTEDGKPFCYNGAEVATELDFQTLKDLHYENTDGTFKKVSEEVDEAIAKVVDGAPEAFDTLKEIAEWIQASQENEDGFDAATRIVALENAVGKEATEGQGEEGEEGYIAPTPATGLIKKVEDLEKSTQAQLHNYSEVEDESSTIAIDGDEVVNFTKEEVNVYGDVLTVSAPVAADEEGGEGQPGKVLYNGKEIATVDDMVAITNSEIDLLFVDEVEDAENNKF